MKNTFTADTLIVLPLDIKKIIRRITKLFPLLDENKKYIIQQEAIVKDVNVITDNECVHYILERHAISKPNSPNFIAHAHTIGVRIKTQTANGSSTPMFIDFHFLIDVMTLEKSFCLAPVSLRQFMSSRYDYNPRIKNNTKGLLNLINENSK